MSKVIYMGVYEDWVLGISKSKKRVRNYIEDIRGLNKNDYEIIEVNMYVENILMKYRNRYLYRFYDAFLPLDDIEILLAMVEEVSILDLLNKVKEFKDITHNNPKFKGLNESLKGLISSIDDLRDDTGEFREDLLDSLMYSYITKNINIEDNITDYIERLKLNMEIHNLNEGFKDAIFRSK